MPGLWLDDERPMPAEFTHHARTAEEAIELLKVMEFDRISLDHDLGIGCGTGYEVACFIEEAALTGRMRKTRISLHTQNPVGRERMRKALYNAHKFWTKGTPSD